MALIVKNYELPDKSILESAYLRVQNVAVANVDYEFFAVSDKEGVESELRWITKLETTANIFVWADEIARSNRAIAVHWFTVGIDYKLSEPTNIFEQVYEKLNKLFPESENV